MAEAGGEVGRGPSGQGVGIVALWLMPCTVIFEWVGGTFYKTMPVRVAYLALFLALYWFARPVGGPRLASRAARLGVGVPLTALGALLFAAAAWCLLGPRLHWAPFPYRPDEWLRLFLPLLAAWPLAMGIGLLHEGGLDARAYERFGVFLALGFLLHLASNVRVQGLPVLARESDRWLIAIALLLVVAAIARGPFWVRMTGLVAVGVGLRVLGILAWQIDPRVRDMLALVESAQDRFASGQTPYALYAMQHGSVLPLTYLPGLWLGYGLPRLVGLDLRFFGPFVEALLFASLAWTASKLSAPRRAFAQAFVFTFAALWFFSPSVQWNAIYAEPTWWWALLGMTLVFSFAGPHWLGALCLGLAIATRHFAIVLAPFVLLYFIRVRGLRGSMPWLAIAAATASGLLFPFVSSQPELFWFGTFRWLREYGPVHIDWFIDRFGFLEPFLKAQALDALPWVQGGLVVACLVGASLVSRPRWIASFAATASLLFIMFNVLLWDSFLLDGAVAACALVVSAPFRARDPEPHALPSPTFYVSLGMLALSALVAGYLVFTMKATLHPSGKQAAHDFMVANVKQGDLVIDRSDRRVAFVQGTWLLRRDEVPAPIGGDFFDPAWAGQSALVAPRKVWLVTHALRDKALRGDFARAGTELEAQELGDFRVQAITPRKMVSAEAQGAPLRTRPCELGWMPRELRAVSVRRGAPVHLRVPGPPGGTLSFGAGIPNDQVVWPRAAVDVRIGERSFSVENLFGTQLAVVPSTRSELIIELSTEDELPREVCLDLKWLVER